MISCPVPALPFELKDIGRLASDALAANAAIADSHNHGTPSEPIPAHHPSTGPTIADWVSINDHLLGLSKDYLLRANRDLSGDGHLVGAHTVLLHALTQRYFAAINPQTLYSVSDFLTAARSFISAIAARQAMDSCLHSSGFIRTLSNGSTLAATITDDVNVHKIGSYWLSVDKVRTARRYSKRVVCDALRRFSDTTPLNDRSFIILVDNISDLNGNNDLVPLGDKNIFACGELKRTHFVIFMTDLLETQELSVVDPHTQEDDFAREPISHSSIYDLIRGNASGRARSRVYFSKTEAEQFALARSAVEHANIADFAATLLSRSDLRYAETRDRICYYADHFVNNNEQSLVRSRISSGRDISRDPATVSHYSDTAGKDYVAPNDSDIFDDPDAPISMSRMARAFFRYKGLRGYDPQ